MKQFKVVSSQEMAGFVASCPRVLLFQKEIQRETDSHDYLELS